MKFANSITRFFLIGLIFLGLIAIFFNFNDKAFFIWTDAYLASAENEKEDLVLTFCYQGNPPFIPKDIKSIEFGQIKNDIEITDFQISDFNPNELGYHAYAVKIKYLPLKKGCFETETIKFVTHKDNELEYEVGNLVFDIDRLDRQFLQIMESPVATSNSGAFTYAYSYLEDYDLEEISFTAIQIGKNTVKHNEQGLPLEGRVDIKENIESPLKIIKPKIIGEYNGKQILNYGIACYCGGVNAEASILQSSRRHWRIKG